jgi:hypothetical protein
VRRLSILAVAAALAAGASGCGGDSGRTLRLVSDAGTSETVDVGQQGKSRGDVYVFDAQVFDEDEQNVVGHVDGTQTSLRVEGDEEVVQTMMTFTLGDRDTLTIGGVSRYPRGEVGLVRNREHVRPILGGTGTYAGAHGEDVTVRRSDGRYEHTLSIAD